MTGFFRQFAPQLYAVLRIVAGLMFACHGTQKLFGFPGGGNHVALVSLMGLGGVIELVGGLMIATGFRTCLAAFVASGQMAVAYFMMHFSHGFLPIVNRGELAVLYCFLFLYVAVQGSGIWSVDACTGKTKPGKGA